MVNRIIIMLIMLLGQSVVLAGQDLRYCGPAKRDDNGNIARSSVVIREFRELYACPSTNKRTGACPRWEIDHVIPLACGGCDTVANLQWLPTTIKRAPGKTAKDRWERIVYCKRM